MRQSKREKITVAKDSLEGLRQLADWLNNVAEAVRKLLDTMEETMPRLREALPLLETMQQLMQGASASSEFLDTPTISLDTKPTKPAKEQEEEFKWEL